jgi:hypothetical protein
MINTSNPGNKLGIKSETRQLSGDVSDEEWSFSKSPKTGRVKT